MNQERSGGFGLDDVYITKAMQDWDAPGLSIAVIKDGATVFSRGYGVLSGNRKARVIKFLPDFALFDPEMTKLLTLKDIVTHSSGVEDGAITNIPARSTKTAIKRLRKIKPLRAHRGGFSYNNTLFAALGQIVEKVSGQSWETFLQSRILDPLGMNNSFATGKSARRSKANKANRALPHHMPKGKQKVKVMEVKDLDFLASSAGLQSNITDMAAWLKFQLGIGSLQATPLLSKEALDEMHARQIEIEPNAFTLMTHPRSTNHGFGMAWFVRDYAQSRIVQHGGYVDGFTSFAVMCPAKGFGVVVLTNMHNSLLPFALSYRVIDAYLGQPEEDWSGYFLEKRADHRNKVSPHDEENNEQEKVNRKLDKKLKKA